MTVLVEPSVEEVRQFVLAGHGNLAQVQEMLAENPALLNVAYEWGPDDMESAIQAAAHMGNAPIMEYLLERGAPLEICTAAALGQRETVEEMLDEEPDLIEAHGAHGIPLLSHAALSGDVALVKELHERGAIEGASAALGNAVVRDDVALAKWLLEHSSADIEWRNYEGKTMLTIANEHDNRKLAELLCEYGATE
jgi:ankyrin repeat protein